MLEWFLIGIGFAIGNMVIGSAALAFMMTNPGRKLMLKIRERLEYLD